MEIKNLNRVEIRPDGGTKLNNERLETTIVIAEGPLDAKICFVGEAPGAEEDATGRPFIGSAGQFLNRVFTNVGIVRKEVLLTNCFLQKPPANDIGYYYQDKGCKKPTWEGEEHIENLRQWLLRRKEEGKVNILVALGGIAMRVLTGKNRITKWRGSLLPCTLVEGFKVYCSFHPSYVMRLLNEPRENIYGEKKKQQQNALPLFQHDLLRVIEQSTSKEIVRPEREFEIALSHEELLDRLTKLNEHKEEIFVAVDIETLPGDSGPLVWCIGFSDHPSRAFVVPILRQQRFAWTLEEEAQLWRAISEVFLNPKVKKIFQGGGYDLSILGRQYGLRTCPGTYEDTMLCHHASYPYIRKGLEVLTSIYTWEPYYKDEGKVGLGRTRGGDQAEFAYNAKDCAVTREIFPITLRNAKELRTYDGYRRTMNIQPSLLGMMIRGVKVDVEKKEALALEFKGKASYHQEEVNRLSAGEYNLNSSDQKQSLLYGFLCLPVQYNRKTGKATTDKDALQKLRRLRPGLEIISHILDYQKFAKLASTYADIELDADGRIRTSYSLVSTWRLNSSKSHFGGGGNLQNIPKQTEEGRMVRQLFIPDEGKELLASDLSQAEARVVAWEAEDKHLIKMFQEGKVDVHWESTKGIFGFDKEFPYEPSASLEWEGESFTLKELRNIGKTVKHATNYDMGPFMLQAILSRVGVFFDFGTCKTLLERTKAANPMLAEWKRKIREEVKATRTLISSFGRKREFMGRLGDDLYRAAYAFSPQNTVGEVLQVAIQNIWEEVDFVDILLNVHDEVIVQAKLKDRKRAIKAIKERMEIPLEIRGRELIIPCDFKVGDNWGEMEEI